MMNIFNKNKLLCKSLLLILVLSIIYPMRMKAYAVDTSYAGIVTLAIDDKTDYATVYEGSEFAINVSITTFGFEGVRSFVATKEFDSSIVEYIGATIYGGGKIDLDAKIEDLTTNSHGNIEIYNENGYKNKELIIQLKFKAKDTTGAEGIDIALTNMSVRGTKGEYINSTQTTLLSSPINVKIIEVPEGPEVPPFSCDLDYANRCLLINRGDNSMFFLSQVDAKGNVKPYEIFEAETDVLKIDLSSYSDKKEWNFIFYGNANTAPININLVPAVRGLKASYNPLGNSIDERIVISVGEDEISIDELEVRTTGGKWEDGAEFTEEQLDIYAVTGATLIFRIKAVEGQSPYSSEVKLKIPKRASAPKVTIDYSKLTIKFPKNSEYRLAHKALWKESPVEKINIGKLIDIKTQALYIEVRTAETEKKAASKFSIISVDVQPEAPTIGNENAGLIISYTKTGETTTGVIIQNTSETCDIEYAIVASNIDNIDLSKQKWKKLTKSSEIVLKKSESDGKVIIARYEAVTSKNAVPQFASQISKSEVIVWNK